ncbi:MAG: ribulose-phosphate 3-epimerase [Bacteroidales bacterium]|nr:ribulose-phosphate 3-epimerase [Bacteroidales bacterium]
MNPLISPSMLSADFCHLAKDIQMVNESAADWFHLDIMDGVFVPNISYGMPLVKAIRSQAEKPLDVHLMIVQPERYVERFKEMGADILTVHWEACTHLHRTIYQIKNADMLAGVALNPHTPVAGLEDVINDVDMVLIMSVNPGFGGQRFIERSLHRVAELKAMIKRNKSECLIEVDGGVDLSNAQALVDAGADVLVAGSAIFSKENPKEIISQLKNVK